MAQLPTLDNLGERPAPQPQTAVLTAQTGYEAAALSGVGEAIASIDAKLTEARRASQLTHAMGAATEALGTKEIEFRRDQDYKTAPARFKAFADDIGKTQAAAIEDPIARQVFLRHFQPLAMAKQLNVVTSAAKQEADYNTGNLDSRLEVYAHAAANATTPLEKDTILNQVRIDIGENVAHGWITDVQGQAFEKRFRGRMDEQQVRADLTKDPAGVAVRLATDPEYGASIDPVKRERLVHTAQMWAETVENKQKAVEKQQNQAIQDDLTNKLLTGKLTLNGILSSGAPGQIQEHFANALRRRSIEDAEMPVRNSPTLERELLQRISLPYGDPKKITDITPIIKAYTDGDGGRRINRQTMEYLQQQIVQDRSPEGAKLANEVAAAMHTAHAMITKGIGKEFQPDKWEEAASRFNQNLRAKVDEYRQANKDPRSLFTPGSPDYVLDQKYVASFSPPRASVSTAPGAPPKISSESDYNKLPSGSIYIDAKDGKQKRKS